MPIFAVRKMDEIKGMQQVFYKLTVDGVCLLDDFENDIKSNPPYYKEFKKILSRMECVANGQSLPGTQFKPINSRELHHVREYEFKSEHLRIYAIKSEGGKTIVCGGFKNTQLSDIRRFQSLKTQFINYINRQ